ncbi:hypothetical protein BDZ89DRAFT_654681 [Hymenopellis radicata]|nr:hypothetical protein BDZ89DRAFT_654681 [Hymenopellis radicata]
MSCATILWNVLIPLTGYSSKSSKKGLPTRFDHRLVRLSLHPVALVSTPRFLAPSRPPTPSVIRALVGHHLALLHIVQYRIITLDLVWHGDRSLVYDIPDPDRYPHVSSIPSGDFGEIGRRKFVSKARILPCVFFVCLRMTSFRLDLSWSRYYDVNC